MPPSLSKSEMRVMAAVWRAGGELSAKEVSEHLAKEAGYNSATSYTLVSRCVKKGALEKVDPGYLCRALVSQGEMQSSETDELVQRAFDGSADKLFSFLVSSKRVSQSEIDRLREFVDSQ